MPASVLRTLNSLDEKRVASLVLFDRNIVTLNYHPLLNKSINSTRSKASFYVDIDEALRALPLWHLLCPLLIRYLIDNIKASSRWRLTGGQRFGPRKLVA